MSRAMDLNSVSRRNFLKMIGAIGASTIIAGCVAPGVETGGSASAPAEGESAAGGGTLIWMSHQEIAGLGPNDLGATMQSIMIGAIHSSLVGYDVEYNMYNDLSESLAVPSPARSEDAPAGKRKRPRRRKRKAGSAAGGAETATQIPGE